MRSPLIKAYFFLIFAYIYYQVLIYVYESYWGTCLMYVFVKLSKMYAGVHRDHFKFCNHVGEIVKVLSGSSCEHTLFQCGLIQYPKVS